MCYSQRMLTMEHSKVKFHGDSVPESIVTSDIFILHACASGAQSSLEFLKPANMSWPSELNFVSVAILSPRRNTSA
jgi:malate synthase